MSEATFEALVAAARLDIVHPAITAGICQEHSFRGEVVPAYLDGSGEIEVWGPEVYTLLVANHLQAATLGELLRFAGTDPVEGGWDGWTPMTAFGTAVYPDDSGLPWVGFLWRSRQGIRALNLIVRDGIWSTQIGFLAVIKV